MLNKILLFAGIFFTGVILCRGEVISARRAFRSEAEKCGYQAEFLIGRLHDPDVEISRYAIMLIAEKHPEAALKAFESFNGRLDPLIAEALLTALASYPAEKSGALQKRFLASCDDPRLQAFGKSKLPYRINFSLRNDPSYDHAVTVIKKIPLPLNNWKFMTDPADEGFDRKFWTANFNDSDWKTLAIGKTWEEQGFAGYDGIAWYRLKFTMPGKMDCNSADIAFGAVDESSWVWLNGKFIGQHDVGAAGWDTPFFLNIASELNWGGENILVVRVKDSAQAGGIWKPVFIEVLK